MKMNFIKNQMLLKKIKNLFISLFTTVLFVTSFNTQAQLLVPYTGSNSLACGNNVILRDHSNYTTYANNANGFTVLNAGQNAVISISGTYDTESGFDYVRIYNGVGISGTLLQSYSGFGFINFTGAPGQTLTVRFSSDGSVLGQGFNLNISYTGSCFTPCTGTPGANSINPSFISICPGQSIPLNLVNTYSTAGITYSWQASNTSVTGPFNVFVNNATAAAINTGILSTTTWYQCVITCTMSGGSITTAPASVSVAATTTNSVPYFEGFEGVGFNGQLPNCSWARSTSSFVCQTYTTAASNNRVPRTGSKFASFYFSPSGTDYFYTNGIQLNPGITYSASLWYTTEFSGLTNFSDLSIKIGGAQTPFGLTTIASSNGPAVSASYKQLSGTFTVASAGFYHIAVGATHSAFGANYLSWDDLSITAPCSLNTPSISITANSTVICEGEEITLQGSGAVNYQWTAPFLYSFVNPVTLIPPTSANFTCTGTDANGCVGTAQVPVSVNACTGLNKIESSFADISVFPNPSSGEFTLATNSGNKYIEVTDVTGRVIRSITTSEEIIKIDISNMSNGIYYVKIKSSDATKITKVIKQ